MAKNRNVNTVYTSEIIIEGTNNSTSARITFESDKINFENTNTGESLLSINSDNSSIALGSALKLPDGTVLNTVNDVNVKDFELRSSSPVVVYQNDTSPKEPGTYITVQAILSNLDVDTATFTLNPQLEFATDNDNPNIIRIPVENFVSTTSLSITATADTFSEEIIITKLLEGGDGISVVVTNPSDVLAADSDGTVFQSDLENAKGQFILYKGATNLTEQGSVVYQIDDATNIDIEFVDENGGLDSTKGFYQVTAFTGLSTALRGGATLKAIYGSATYPFNYSVTKAIKGQPGQDGADGIDGQDGASGESPYLGIVPDENIFIDTVNNDDVANISESAIGNSFNKEINGIVETFYPLSDTIGIFKLLIGNETVDSSQIEFDLGTDNLDYLSKNGLHFAIEQDGSFKAFIKDRVSQNDTGWLEVSQAEIFTIRAKVDGIVRSEKNIKIQKTKIGLDGKTGPSVKLQIQPQYFNFNGEGLPIDENQALQIKVVPLNIEANYPGFSVNIVSDPVLSFGQITTNPDTKITTTTLPVTNFKDLETDEFHNYAVVTAQILDSNNEVVLEDPVTIARTQAGVNAKSIVLSTDSFVIPFKNNSVQPELDSVNITIKTQNLTNEITLENISITKADSSIVTKPLGTLTNNNDGSYSFTLYVNSSDQNQISLGISNRNDVDAAFPIKIRVDAEESFDLITIGKLEASDGLSGQLTNEVDEIPAFSDGNTDVGDYSTLNGTFQVFVGTTQIQVPSEDVVFSIVAEDNPAMDVVIDSSSGYYYVVQDSISQGADVARRYLTATYRDDTTITKIFTVVKAKQGRNSINAVLSNESHTIRATSDGELLLTSDLSTSTTNTAGGSIKVYSGNENVTLDCSFEVLAGSETADPITASPTEYTSGGLTFTVFSTGEYKLSTDNTASWETDAEIFYVRINYPDPVSGETVSITKSYTITKSKGGADAKILILKADRQVFTFNSDNDLLPDGQKVIFEASLQNITSDLEWYVNDVKQDSETLNLLLTALSSEPDNANKKVLAGADFRETGETELVVEARAGNFSDKVTIIKTKDGAAGSNAKTLKITSTSNVVLYPDKESQVPDPTFITVFLDGTNLETAITSDLIYLVDKNDNPITVPALSTDSVDSNDKYFVLNIKNGEDDTNFDIQKSDFPITISASIDGVRDIITLNALEGGSNGINLLMSNESHVVPADSNGDVDVNGLADAGGVLELYEGINKKENTAGQTDVVKFTIKQPTVAENVASFIDDQSSLQTSLTLSSGLIISVNQETGEYSISETDPDGWQSLKETVEFIAEYAGNPFTKKYSISKSKEGVAGQNGKDGKTVILESDRYFIPYLEDNTTEVSAFQLSATAYNLDSEATITYEFSKGTVDVTDDDTLNTLTVSDLPTPGESDTYFVNVFENGQQVAQDSVSIIATKEGSDAITVSIPNDNHTFTAESNGEVLDNSNSGTKIQVLVGNTVLNALESSNTLLPGTFKISTNSSLGITAGSLTRTDLQSSNYKSFTMDNVSIDSSTNNGTITFTIELIKPNSTTSTTITRIASYSKSPKGVDGSNAKALFLQSDAQSFFLNKEGSVINDTITFSALKENISGDVSYSTIPANLLDLSTGNPILSYTNFGSNTSVKVTATATEPATETTEAQTYTSSITIGKVESGADGDTGPKGTDAKTVKLESDDYQISYDAAGNNPNGATTNTIVLTATQQNHSSTDTLYYEFILNGDSTPTKQNTSSNSYVYTLPTTKDAFGNPKTFTVNTREGSNTGTIIASDSISIVATKDGENSFTIAVTNENHTFVANEINQVIDYTGGGTEIQVYYGNTQLTAVSSTTTLSQNQFKVSISSNTNITAGSITPTGENTSAAAIMSQPSSMDDSSNSASIILGIEVKGVGASQTFYRTLSYSKSKKGSDGIDNGIYNFSKTYDDNGIARAFGWRGVKRNSTGTDYYQEYKGSFLFSSRGEVVSNSGAKQGGNVLKVNYTHADSGDNNDSSIFSDFIPVDTTKTYTLDFRAKQTTSTETDGLTFYLATYDENKNYVNNSYFINLVNTTGTDWQERQYYITGESTSNPTWTNGEVTHFRGSNVKYVRLLMWLNFQGTSRDLLVDYFSIKEATANLDASGRITEGNSSTNKPKVIQFGESPPSNPVEGDLITVVGNSNFAGKTYIYSTKEYSFGERPNFSNISGLSSLTGDFYSDGTKTTSWSDTLKTTIIPDETSNTGIVRFIHTRNEDRFGNFLSYGKDNALYVKDGTYIQSQDRFYGKCRFIARYKPVKPITNGGWSSDEWNPSDSTDVSYFYFYVDDGAGNYTVQYGTDNLNSSAVPYTSTFVRSYFGTFSAETGNRYKEAYYDIDQNNFYRYKFYFNHQNGNAILLDRVIVQGWVPYVDEDLTLKSREIESYLTNFSFSFTGQHKCVLDSLSEIEAGMIVSSVGTYDNVNYQNSNLENKILPIEAIPKIKLSQKEKDKAVIGVVADHYLDDGASKIFSSDGKKSFQAIEAEQIEESQQRTPKIRYRVNSIGEGGIWVTNYSGNLENGDYITSSPIPGYGMKQDDNILRNYTVAKITCDCDFNLESEIYDCEEFEWEGQIYRRAFVGCTYHCG